MSQHTFTGFPQVSAVETQSRPLGETLALIAEIKRAVGSTGGQLDWISMGLFTDRPAAGYPPRLYWATDTKHLYLDDGAWNTIV